MIRNDQMFHIVSITSRKRKVNNLFYLLQKEVGGGAQFKDNKKPPQVNIVNI